MHSSQESYNTTKNDWTTYHAKPSVGGGRDVSDDSHGQTDIAFTDASHHTSQHEQCKTVRQRPQNIRKCYSHLDKHHCEQKTTKQQQMKSNNLF